MMMYGNKDFTTMVAQTEQDVWVLEYFASLLRKTTRMYFNRPNHTRLTFRKPTDEGTLKMAVRRAFGQDKRPTIAQQVFIDLPVLPLVN